MSTLTPSLAIGDEIIDTQHEELLARAEALAAVAPGAIAPGAVADLLAFLEAYCLDHFATEARLMRSVGYPAAEAHLAEHAEFSSRVSGLQASFEAPGASPSVALEIHHLVVGWLGHHVDTSDRALAAYASTRAGVPSKPPR